MTNKFNFNFLRNNPSKILLFSFIFVIGIGTFLLLLPISNKGNIDFIDVVFTSVSATCVTGLLTINPFNDLTIFGQIILLIMIQIGGLGLISFIALFLKIRNEKLSFDERKLLKDSFNKFDDKDVTGYLLSIFKYTFITEFVGFVLLLINLYDGSIYSIFQSLFLSISSFCNAGIDVLGSTSLSNYSTNVPINIIIEALILLGGIGFIVWYDFFDNLIEWIKKRYSFNVFYRKLKLHTKIVVFMTILLIFSGSFIFYIFENNNVLKEYLLIDKINISIFSSFTLRTAGFYTIDFSKLRDVTKLVMCLYMLVGASPGGTAGGFKTTTLFIMFLGLVTLFRRKEKMNISKREISYINFYKASIIMFLYMIVMIVGLIVLTITDNINTIDLLFEASSALGTVGLSANVTPNLTIIGKIVIMCLMFIGRVGPTTLLLSLSNKDKSIMDRICYPTAEIIVG